VLSGKHARRAPQQKAAKAARDAEAARRSRLSAPIFRDAGRGRQVAVPTAVSMRRGQTACSGFTWKDRPRGYPYSGWYKPAPPKASSAARGKPIGEPLTFDYFTGRYVPWLSPSQSDAARYESPADEWFPDELDPRRPTYSARTHTGRGQRKQNPEQEPARREDCLAVRFSLDYWNEPKGGGA